MRMKSKLFALLVPALLSFATAQAGELPVPAAPEAAAVAPATEPGCGDTAALPMEEILQAFTPAVQPQEPLLKAGCTGSYGSCQCYKISGQRGCLTSGSGSDCDRCCANLHC